MYESVQLHRVPIVAVILYGVSGIGVGFLMGSAVSKYDIMFVASEFIGTSADLIFIN